MRELEPRARREQAGGAQRVGRRGGAVAPERPASAATWRGGAPGPRIATARATSRAPAGSRSSIRATSRATASGPKCPIVRRVGVGAERRPRARDEERVAAGGVVAGGADAGARVRVPIAHERRGGLAARAAAGAATARVSRSSSSTGSLGGSPLRTASSASSGSPSIRRARCPSQRSDGGSAQCASSTTIASGRSAHRFAASQNRPCSVAWVASSPGAPAAGAASSAGSASAAASAVSAVPVRRPARDGIEQRAHGAERVGLLERRAAGAEHAHARARRDVRRGGEQAALADPGRPLDDEHRPVARDGGVQRRPRWRPARPRAPAAPHPW